MQTARSEYIERGFSPRKITPKGINAKATLANLGQMQAIAHDVSAMIGVYMDVRGTGVHPMVRRNPASGCLYLVMVPSQDDPDAFLTAVRRVPVLEGLCANLSLLRRGKMVD